MARPFFETRERAAPFYGVIAGLDPAIHDVCQRIELAAAKALEGYDALKGVMDARVEARA